MSWVGSVFVNLALAFVYTGLLFLVVWILVRFVFRIGEKSE